MQRTLTTCVMIVALNGLSAYGQNDKPTLREQVKMFESQPRHLFGTGTIWAKWLERDWSCDAIQFEMIRQMGGTHTSADIPWIGVEEVQGKWDFEYVDHIVAQAEPRGLELFAYMGLTPDWALPPEAPEGARGIGYRFPPPDDKKDAFIEYCKRVARRYKGKVKYYTFWNEPNGCSWVKDGCGNADGYPLYTKWLKIWYTAMKSEDPDCVLGAGALDYHSGVTEGYTYLEGMYREGAEDYFDAFNIHPYDSKGTLHYRALEDTRRVMVEHGDAHKGIWLSEYGWNTKDEDLKSRRLEQVLKELASPKYFYVTMANYLSLRDPAGEAGFGLVNNDLTPRKSYETYKRVALELRLKQAREPLGKGKTPR